MSSFINSIRNIFTLPFAARQIEQGRLDYIQANMHYAEETFAKLGSANEAEKLWMGANLIAAWNELASIRKEGLQTCADQSSQLARIALMRGKTFWAKEDMEISRQIFSLSLMCALARSEQLAALPGIDENGLEELIKRLAVDPTAFASLEDELASAVQSDAIIREALDLGPEAAMAAASAARDLGGVYQNHTSYKLADEDSEAVKERKIQLCEHAIGIADQLWEKIGTEEASWLQLTSKYNTGPYLHGLRHPDDVEGKAAIYRDVLARLEALEQRGNKEVKLFQQRAQCYNMLAILLSETLPDAERYALISKSADAALEHAGKGFDLFLSRMFPQNRASFAFQCLQKGAPIEGVTIEMIDQWHDQVQENCAEGGYSHFYDAIFCLNAAKAAQYRGDKEKCERLLAKAEEVCGKHPNSTADILAKIIAFRG